jgi:hypothetical protein
MTARTVIVSGGTGKHHSKNSKNRQDLPHSSGFILSEIDPE